MRELERHEPSPTPCTPASPGPADVPAVGIVGAGRAGTALAAALRRAGVEVHGPVGRGEVPAGDVLLLCVVDDEIENAARTVAGRAPFVGHVSGATPLSALEPAAAAGAEAFGLHPLQTLTGEEDDLTACGAAVAGSTQRSLSVANAIAERLGMLPFEIDDARRAAYHAAASIASNFLVTLEHAAEQVAGAAGLGPEDARRLFAPLVEQTVRNWAAAGPEDALTGPIARGDEATVARQRAAVAAARPDLVPLFDALTDVTRALAGRLKPAEVAA